jgi:hypothetical protein
MDGFTSFLIDATFYLFLIKRLIFCGSSMLFNSLPIAFLFLMRYNTTKWYLFVILNARTLCMFCGL